MGSGCFLELVGGGWGGFFCKEGDPPPPPQGPSTNVPAPSARLAPLQTYWDVTRDLVLFLPEGEPRGKGQKRWVTGSAPTPSPWEQGGDAECGSLLRGSPMPPAQAPVLCVCWGVPANAPHPGHMGASGRRRVPPGLAFLPHQPRGTGWTLFWKTPVHPDLRMCPYLAVGPDVQCDQLEGDQTGVGPRPTSRQSQRCTQGDQMTSGAETGMHSCEPAKATATLQGLEGAGQTLPQSLLAPWPWKRHFCRLSPGAVGGTLWGPRPHTRAPQPPLPDSRLQLLPGHLGPRVLLASGMEIPPRAAQHWFIQFQVHFCLGPPFSLPSSHLFWNTPPAGVIFFLLVFLTCHYVFKSPWIYLSLYVTPHSGPPEKVHVRGWLTRQPVWRQCLSPITCPPSGTCQEHESCWGYSSQSMRYVCVCVC